MTADNRITNEVRESRNRTTPAPLIRPVMPELDTIRGLAILGVLIYHSFYWNVSVPKFPAIQRAFLTFAGLGRLGVDLFFVLSGFLITGILLKARSEPKYYKRFYVHRALRIFPAYLLIILMLVVSHHVPYAFIALSLVYLSNLTPFFGVPMAYPVLWSLAVEEHFYLLWPFVVKHLSKVALMAVCVGIVILSPISRLVGYHIVMHKVTFDTYQFHQYTWNALDGLACGAALSIWLNRYVVPRRSLTILSYALLGIAVLMWGTLWPFGIALRHTALGAALEAVPWHFAFTALLGLFLLIGTTYQKRLVQSVSLRFLGRVSYGLYLIHMLMFDAVDYLGKHGLPGVGKATIPQLFWRSALACTASIFLAALSRNYFEDRFLALKARFT
jgi:peptidoglycan/LPS O-acetylase OafA/YrhL